MRSVNIVNAHNFQQKKRIKINREIMLNESIEKATEKRKRRKKLEIKMNLIK